MRALIDSCVVIDALQSREGFEKDAQNIFLAAANNAFLGYITAKSVTDIYYLMHRHTHSDKVSRETLNKLFMLFEALDMSSIDCRKAVPSPVSDFEDAVMIDCAPLGSGLHRHAERGGFCKIARPRALAESIP